MEESIRELQVAVYGESYLEGGKLGGISGDIEEIKERLSEIEERVKELEELRGGSEWLSPRQALAYLSISKATFYKAVHEGKLPLYKLDLKDSKLVRVKRSDLDQLFKLSE